MARRQPVFVLFGTNLALNLAWNLMFFRGRSPLAAGVEIVALESTTLALVVRAWPLSRLAALLLVPYAIWIAFATALTGRSGRGTSAESGREARRGQPMSAGETAWGCPAV